MTVYYVQSIGLVSREMQRWATAPVLRKQALRWQLYDENKDNNHHNHSSHLLSTCCVPGIALSTLIHSPLQLMGETTFSPALWPSATDLSTLPWALDVLPPQGLALFPLPGLFFAQMSMSHSLISFRFLLKYHVIWRPVLIWSPR